MSDRSNVCIIGAGLAGCEAALILARKGVSVDLFEMRPEKRSPAHSTGLPAELVCSNSLKSQDLPGAHGLLKHELAILNSPLLTCAKSAAVSAGSALAVDREKFSRAVLHEIEQSPHIRLVRQEIIGPPSGYSCTIIAAGPLASSALCTWITTEFSSQVLNFYDALAPIIDADSIDWNIVFKANRWEDAEGGDYGNCPFSQDEYEVFYRELMVANSVVAREFEDVHYFEGCLPVEVVAHRGHDALRFGILKPVGLNTPFTGRRNFAVCQLRKENEAGTSYNLVGFQTRLTFSEQKRVFSLIPGLANAEFLRYGSCHRNTYFNSPDLLANNLSFKNRPDLFLAGQICGNEGYTESIATGHLAALFVAARLSGAVLPPPPDTTACGALLKHITASPVKPFTPTNVHFGLFPPLPATGRKIRKGDKKHLLCERALDDCKKWFYS